MIAQELLEISYRESFAIFINPEGGLAFEAQVTNETDGSDLIARARTEGCSLVKVILYAPEYQDRDFDQHILDNLRSAFEACRQYGVKAITWVSYNNSGEDMFQNKTQILRHIEQLGPIYHEYKDVIAFFKLGFIGPWGEMHSSNLDNAIDTKDILFAMLAATPSDRMITVRRPEHKIWAFGEDPITEDEAFSGTYKARVGFFNDCFLSSDTDWGTYPGASTREKYVRYISNESKYTPFGGETCDLYDYNNCTDPHMEELERLHVRYLSKYWNNLVWQKWYRQGCYFTIRQKLGYRFVLRTLKISPQVKPGGVLRIILTIDNVGYGALYNPRPVFLVLRNRSSGIELKAKISTDPRWWQPESPITLDRCFRIPKNLPEGSYEVLLWLPDESEILRDDPRFAVRFANSDVWEAQTGYNLLFDNLLITRSAPGTFTNENIFYEIPCRYLNGSQVSIGNTYTSGTPVKIKIFSPSDNVEVKVTVLDIWGRIRYSKTATVNHGDNILEVPYENLSPGVNILRIRIPSFAEDFVKDFKVVKR